jgi:hypothetical protein
VNKHSKKVENKGIVKFFLAILISNLIRFLRFIPNNDPIMAVMLPFAKEKSIIKAFLFPFLTMITFDLITGFIGSWTLITAITYGLLGVFFTILYSKKKEITLKTYLGSGIIGVLIFDFVTGVLATPLMFGMSIEQAFIGQIPFTIMHLATVSGFILIITPVLDKHLFKNKNLEDHKILARILSKVPQLN